jgi:ubiquinone/menaquinone biosynthesis C-methylase UbiE
MSEIPSLYADLSVYYDRFCAEVDYAEQCAFANRAFGCFATSGGQTYLDLACGTGPHLLHMRDYSFELNGLDNSARMLEQAAVKVPDAHLVLADMAALDQHHAYDLVTCFLYSIHYSHPLSAMRTTLQQVWKALKPGGVFIFNAVDARGARHQHTVTTHLQAGDLSLQFSSGWHYSGTGEVLDLRLSITEESPGGRRCWQDQHRMTALSLPALEALLHATGFEVNLFEHDYSLMSAWEGQSFNAIVVARKPDC